MNVLIYGASGGIGKALCKEFDLIGAKICMVGRSEEKLKCVISDLNQDNHLIHVNNSLTNKMELNRTTAFLKQLDIKFHIGIFTAGQGLTKKVVSTSLDDWNRIMEINLTSAFLFSKLFLNLSRTDRYELIYFGSQSIAKGWPKNGAYGTSKAGLKYLTTVLQKEIRSDGGRVWLYEAGSVNTEFFQNIKNHIPPAKMIQPSALAKMVVANLATDPDLYSTSVSVLSD
ncbi:MAG: SDR family oxidoreductase [Proteobacteria bacterium]|nr:SDR family oxidoreductase [Pseudomonadota bacterium]